VQLAHRAQPLARLELDLVAEGKGVFFRDRRGKVARAGKGRRRAVGGKRGRRRVAVERGRPARP
jgi:hypothetical protein